MPPTAPTPRSAHRHRRRGVSTAGMIVGLALLAGFTALAVDMGVLMIYEVEARAASDAAVLAGVAQLWDRTLLPDHLQQLDLPAPDRPGEGVANQQLRLAAEEARRLAAQNTVGGLPLRLADQDIRPGTLGNENSLTIQAPFTAERGNPVTRVVGRVVGLTDADLIVESQAVLDHRVYGFAPGSMARVPLVPLAVDEESWIEQLRIDSAVVLRLGNNSAADNAGLVAFETLVEIEQTVAAGTATAPQPAPLTSTVPTSTAAIEQLLRGLDEQDLLELPGRCVALDDSSANGKLDLPRVEAADLRTLAAALHAIGGQRRIWPLGETLVTADGRPGHRIRSFAAARVVQCTLDESSLTVVLEPCLLACSAALVRADQPRNPWVAKGYLVR